MSDRPKFEDWCHDPSPDTWGSQKEAWNACMSACEPIIAELENKQETYRQAIEALRPALVEQRIAEASEYPVKLYQYAIKAAMTLCPGCAHGEPTVAPRRSSTVGLAAIHPSGLICIPRTIQELVAERHNREANRAKAEGGGSSHERQTEV